MTPKLAAWLMALVTTPEKVQSILGDLEEESAIIAARLGSVVARRWLRRQIVVSVPQLLLAQLRLAPLNVGLWAAATLLIFNIVEDAIEMPVRFIVTHHAVYHYLDASLFWRITTAAEVYVAPPLVGALIARLARERAVAAIIVMALFANIWAYPAIWLRTMPVLKAEFFLQPWPTFVLTAARMAGLVVGGAVASRTIQVRHEVA